MDRRPAIPATNSSPPNPEAVARGQNMPVPIISDSALLLVSEEECRLRVFRESKLLAIGGVVFSLVVGSVIILLEAIVFDWSNLVSKLLIAFVATLGVGYAWYRCMLVGAKSAILADRLAGERALLRAREKCAEDDAREYQREIERLRRERSNRIEARIRAVESVTETLTRLNTKLAEAHQLVDWMADKPETRDRILAMNRDWKAADNEWLQFDRFGMTESKDAFRQWMTLSGSALTLAYSKSDVFCTFPESPQKYDRLLSLSEQGQAAFKEADDLFELLGPIFNREIEKDVT